MSMRDFNKGFSRCNRDFKVFAEASRVIQPGESAFNDPPPREFFPFVGFDFLRNINVHAQLLIYVGYESSPVSSVSAKFLDGRVSFTCLFCSKNTSFRIMDIGRVNNDRQQVSHYIYYDVAFSAFCFFPPSIPRSSLAATVFTL